MPKTVKAAIDDCVARRRRGADMRIKAQSEEEVKEEARIRFREMLFRRSVLQRGVPVVKELIWLMKGRQDEAEHQRILPDYCYNMFERFKRTLFEGMPTLSETIAIRNQDLAAKAKSVEETKQCATVDWENLGIVIGCANRCFRFYEVESEEHLKQEGRSDYGKIVGEELVKWHSGSDWRVQKMMAMEENAKGSVQKLDEIAYQWGPEAMTLFRRGMARGTSGVLDEKGVPVGKSKLPLIRTYRFLVTAWPEIQEMISADPPKTRNDLWDWLAPFSNANWIEIKDLDQLNRFCESVQLKLKKPGAPRKEK
jgi:hypothetical protein